MRRRSRQQSPVPAWAGRGLDCRVCLNNRTDRGDRSYTIPPGVMLVELSDGSYAHADHTPEAFDRYEAEYPS